AARVGRVLVEPFAHLRLVVVQVHLRRPADHVQIDDVLRLCRVVCPGRFRAVRGRGRGTGAVGVQQRGQGSPANGVCSGGKEVAARHVQNKLIEGIHREGPPFPPLAALHRLLSRKRQSTHRYLFSTSSRFISWLTTI